MLDKLYVASIKKKKKKNGFVRYCKKCHNTVKPILITEKVIAIWSQTSEVQPNYRLIGKTQFVYTF